MNWLVKQLEYSDSRKSSNQMAFLINFGCHVALRRGDLLNLRWSDIVEDVDDEIIPVNSFIIKEGKRGAIRKITLNESIRNHIKRYYDSLNVNLVEYVFSNRDGDQMSDRYFNAELSRINKRYKLGVSTFSTHSFRKTWARHLWDKNGQTDGILSKISHAIGHKDTATTRIYLGIKDQEVVDLYCGLDD